MFWLLGKVLATDKHGKTTQQYEAEQRNGQGQYVPLAAKTNWHCVVTTSTKDDKLEDWDSETSAQMYDPSVRPSENSDTTGVPAACDATGLDSRL